MTSKSASNPESYGSIHALLPLLEQLEQAGYDVPALLRRAGLPEDARSEPQARLPKDRLESLWQVAIDETRDPALALRVATRVQANALGVIGYLASASDSRRSAFELVKDLTPLLWEDFSCTLEGNDEVAFIRCSTRVGVRPSRFMSEYWVGITVTMSRLLGASRFEPIEARFSHAAPAHADEYERILQLPVRFDTGEDGVLFPSSMLDSSNPASDASLRQVLERHAAEQLTRIPATARFSDRIRATIVAQLFEAHPSTEAVATRLRMSQRTLRRRLQLEGTSYQEILDDVRVELARRYLAEERRGIDEVALLLRFSDASAFTKAFRRWTGQTPADYVRVQTADRSSS